jgi:TPP-dependent pyruvate/acetoin dehydrogenase alpha subunit
MINPKWAEKAYTYLIKVRKTEEAIASEYKNQEMRCPVHLSIGQEAVAVGVSMCLGNEDIVFSNHRCHSHYLAKGGNVDAMIAELYGKSTGCVKGLGGSMHLMDDTVGMLGASSIVGGSIPLAVGAGLTLKMQNKPHAAVTYFGDGAAEEGVFHESMNFAALKKLPVIFVCENNYTATSSPLSARRPMDNIYRHGEVFGIPGTAVDGNDVVAVYEATCKAMERIRNGEGPSLIEAKTFRMLKHVGPEKDLSSGIRTEEEWNRWMAKCPVQRFEEKCLAQNLLSAEAMEKIKKRIEMEIERAFELAKSAPAAEWI